MTGEQNFFAFIKDNNGANQVKRIRVNQPLQAELIQIFEEQQQSFEKGIDTEIPFNGDWKPDKNEVLVINNVEESETFVNAVKANASSFSDLDLSNFTNEPIKAIFTGITSKNDIKIFVQKFSAIQALSRYPLPILKMQKGNTFVKATDDIFTIDNKLVAIIDNDKTKFKSFHNARMVFNLSNYYKEATNEDLEKISQHESLEIANVDEFIKVADTQVRKMVHSITASEVLDKHTVSYIETAASQFSEIQLSVSNGKLVIPESKKALKEVLHFLLEDIYKGPLSGSDYLTNSKRVYESVKK